MEDRYETTALMLRLLGFVGWLGLIGAVFTGWQLLQVYPFETALAGLLAGVVSSMILIALTGVGRAIVDTAIITAEMARKQG